MDYSTSEYSSHLGAELEVALSDPFADSTTVASLWEQVLDDRYSDRAFSHNLEESISSPTNQYSLPRLGSSGLFVPSIVVEQEYNVSSASEEPTSEDRCDSRHLSTPELLPFTLETSLEGSNFIISSDAAESHKPDISVPKHQGRDSAASGAKSSRRLRAATSSIRSAIKNLLHRKQSDSNNLFINRHTSETASSLGFLKRWMHRRSESVTKPHIEVELGRRGWLLPYSSFLKWEYENHQKIVRLTFFLDTPTAEILNSRLS